MVHIFTMDYYSAIKKKKGHIQVSPNDMDEPRAHYSK